MASPSKPLETEVAHTLFMDIVGYSRLSMEAQSLLDAELLQVVREAPEFQSAEIQIPAGDGMALVFFGDPRAPAQCALEIAHALRNRPDLPLRMGIHIGPVSRTTDISGKANVSGDGINMAKRVVDCGDAGHILLSSNSADMLRPFEGWASRLVELGPYEVKHGVRLHLYTLCTDDIGNPNPPSRASAAPPAERSVAAVARPAAPQEAMRAVGGAVRIGSERYIERPADAAFLQAIDRQEGIALIKGGRQMGKTSLLARGLQQARERGAKTVWTDFQEFNEATFATPDALLRAMATQVADTLDLEVSPEAFWSAGRDPNANLRRYLEKHVLNTFAEPMVWGLDEVDRLFPCPFADDIFALIRALHNRGRNDAEGLWSRLTFAIAHSTEPHLFITNINMSPFNVGVRLALSDFTPDEAAELNRRYGEPLHTTAELTRLHALLNGHPYLTGKALYEMSENGLTLDSLETRAAEDAGPFSDHLRRLRASLALDSHLTESLRAILRGGLCAEEADFYRLRSAGLLVGERAEDARLRCRLYATYLHHHLL